MLDHRDALQVIHQVRGEQIVISTMTSVGIWSEISDTALDFAYLPSSMGQGISLGLGLALAQPVRGVIAVIGDGSLLMNLGSLVTVANHPAPLHVVLIDNGVYELTGGQRTAGSRRTDFASLARAAGINRVYEFNVLADWEAAAAEVLNSPDPSFVWLHVNQQTGPSPAATAKHPMREQIARLRERLVLGDG